jgi:TPR repeat protein
MLEARGFDGPPDMSAAVAYWRDATRQGDPVAPMDLGFLHLLGTDIVGDKDQAIEYFKTAVERGNWRAGTALAIELFHRSRAGDADAARTAADSLESVIKTAIEKDEIQGAVISSEILGRILLQYSPPDIRDPDRAIGHLVFAGKNKSVDVAIDLSKYYETGTHVERDLLEAYQYMVFAYMKTRNKKVEYKARMDSLLNLMTETQRAQAESSYGIWTGYTADSAAWLPDKGFIDRKSGMALKRPEKLDLTATN